MAVALYARVSTTRQADNELSIPDQLRQLREWCRINGYAISREYVEPGASARDDKRPVFQEMITDCLLSPAPYEAIVIHSLSRFFRDSLEFALYERKLKRAGVRIISITQQTPEDAAGEMSRKLLSLFDEYQSKENAKHTLRAMNENARQGFFNGSRPPFGYRIVETDTPGNRGRRKKKLAIEPAEAGIVRRIYALYLQGHHGIPQGMKNIASILNNQGITMRGNRWRAQKINRILSDPVYKGEYTFNRKSARNESKPVQEQVITPVPAIIDVDMFEQIRARREQQAPDKAAPRIASSPVFLSGILKCGKCGSGMTLMTGKSGRYRYYKCDRQKHSGKALCDTPNIPMDQLDTLVRERLAERVFTPRRVRNMLQQLKKHIAAQSKGSESHLAELKGALRKSESAMERLFESVEQGILPLDDALRTRAEKLRTQRDDITAQIAGIEQQQRLPVKRISPKQINAFCSALKQRFNDPESAFGKGYLRLLVDEVRIDGKEAVLRGSHDALADVIDSINPGNSTLSVPSRMRRWRALEDSNL